KEEDVSSPSDSFRDFAEFYEATNPSTDSERALVGGYWFQEVKGQSDWGSRVVNAELNGLGHGLVNITTSLSDLMNKKPKLVIQTAKTGSSQQAHKKYRVTGEGLKRVRQMLNRSGNPPAD